MSSPDGVMIRADQLRDGDVLVLPFGYEASVSNVRVARMRVHFETKFGKVRVEKDDEVRIKERPGQALVKRVLDKITEGFDNPEDSTWEALSTEAVVRTTLREAAAWLREDMAGAEGDIEYRALEGAIEKIEEEATP